MDCGNYFSYKCKYGTKISKDLGNRQWCDRVYSVRDTGLYPRNSKMRCKVQLPVKFYSKWIFVVKRKSFPLMYNTSRCPLLMELNCFYPLVYAQLSLALDHQISCLSVNHYKDPSGTFFGTWMVETFTSL